jgi:hypothetical protein
MTKPKQEQPQKPSTIVPERAIPYGEALHIVRRKLAADAYEHAAHWAAELGIVLAERATAIRRDDDVLSLRLAHRQMRLTDELNKAQATARDAHGDDLLGAYDIDLKLAT